eukprot:TRINITY_DN3216_c0_g1_i3.p1 TRINITY_DN3216_c0_g1~~TRINITY_DN3216_c0_g1_i3.p1  ORF type:complete len:5718 (+),score=1253.32 TRINITY_DN3216_c0_g1_i3:120-17273(+)
MVVTAAPDETHQPPTQPRQGPPPVGGPVGAQQAAAGQRQPPDGSPADAFDTVKHEPASRREGGNVGMQQTPGTADPNAASAVGRCSLNGYCAGPSTTGAGGGYMGSTNPGAGAPQSKTTSPPSDGCSAVPPRLTFCCDEMKGYAGVYRVDVRHAPMNGRTTWRHEHGHTRLYRTSDGTWGFTSPAHQPLKDDHEPFLVSAHRTGCPTEVTVWKLFGGTTSAGLRSARVFEGDPPPARKPVPGADASPQQHDHVTFHCEAMQAFAGAYTLDRDWGMVNDAFTWKKHDDGSFRISKTRAGQWIFTKGGTKDDLRMDRVQNGVIYGNALRYSRIEDVQWTWRQDGVTNTLRARLEKSKPQMQRVLDRDALHKLCGESLGSTVSALITQSATLWRDRRCAQKRYSDAVVDMFKDWMPSVTQKLEPGAWRRLGMFLNVCDRPDDAVLHNCAIHLLKLTAECLEKERAFLTESAHWMRALCAAVALACLAQKLSEAATATPFGGVAAELDGSRANLMRVCSKILAGCVRLGRTELMWEALAHFGAQLRVADSAICGSLVEVLQGTVLGLTDQGEGEEAVLNIRTRIELAVCVGPRRQDPPSWAKVLRWFPTWKFELLSHGVSSRCPSEYSPRPMTDGDLRDYIEQTASDYSAEFFCRMMEQHASVIGEQHFTARTAEQLTKACFRSPSKVQRSIMVKYCEHARRLFPPETWVQAVRLTVDALLQDRCDDIFLALRSDGGTPEVLGAIEDAARTHVLSLHLNQRQVPLPILARVLVKMHAHGLDLNVYLETKRGEPAEQLVELIGLLLKEGVGLYTENVIHIIWSCARARTDSAPPVGLLNIIQHMSSNSWDEIGASKIKDGLQQRLISWAPPVDREDLHRRSAYDFITTNVSGGPAPLFKNVWPLVAERMMVSHTASRGREAACGAEPVPVTEHPVFGSARGLDDWLFKKVDDLVALSRNGDPLRRWALCQLLAAYVCTAGIPLLQPRNCGLSDECVEVKLIGSIDVGIQASWTRFKELNASAVARLRECIKSGALSQRDVAELERNDASILRAIGHDPEVWQGAYAEAKTGLHQLRVVFRELEDAWHVAGVEEEREVIERTYAKLDEMHMCDINRQIKSIKSGLKRDVPSLKRMADSVLFMQHYQAQREDSLAQDEHISLKVFNSIQDKALASLRGITRDTRIKDVLLSIETDVDDRKVVPEHERSFLESDVKCDQDIVGLVVDHVVPLATKLSYLSHFRALAGDGRASANLCLHEAFFDGDEQRDVLLMTPEQAANLPLSEAPAALQRLSAAADQCPPHALRLIGAVLRCPGIVDFVLQHPDTLSPILAELLSNTRDKEQVEVQEYTSLLPYLLPFVRASAKFKPADFANIADVSPVQRCGRAEFFKELSCLHGLDREAGFSRIEQSLQVVSSKDVLDRLEDLHEHNQTPFQKLNETCEAFLKATVTIDLPVVGQPSFQCTYGPDDAKRCMDLPAFKSTLERVTLLHDPSPVLQEFRQVANAFQRIYFNVSALSEESHVEFRDRCITFLVGQCRHKLNDIIKALEEIRSEWGPALDRAVNDAPQLAVLSTAEQVRMAQLLRDGGDKRRREDVLRAGWHIAAGLGFVATRERFEQVLECVRRPGGRGRSKHVAMDAASWESPPMKKQEVLDSTREILCSIGALLRDLQGEDARRLPASVPVHGAGKAMLMDVSHLGSAAQQRLYCRSRFSRLRAHHWLECSTATTVDEARAFKRRFDCMPSGQMAVMHFQALPTEAQGLLRAAARQSTREKQLHLYVTQSDRGVDACKVPAPNRAQWQDIHRSVAEASVFKDVMWYGDASGMGKSTAILQEIGKRMAQLEYVLNVDLDATTTVDDVCTKLMAEGPWGRSGGEEALGALVVQVGHDADPDIVNKVLDGLLLLGCLVSPSGHSCATSAWRGWTVFIELQQSETDWEDCLDVLQIQELAHRGQCQPFNLDLLCSAGLPVYPHAQPALEFIRKYYTPEGGWRTRPGSAVDCLRQLVAECGTEPTTRALARAAHFLSARFKQQRSNPYFVEPRPRWTCRCEQLPCDLCIGKRLCPFLARSSVHMLHQYLCPGSDSHFHVCAREDFCCLVLRGELEPPLRAALEELSSRIDVASCADSDASGRRRRVRLHRLVNMLASELAVQPKIITDSILEGEYILTPDFLRKMIQLWQRIELGDPVVLEGPSGTGKTRCIAQLAALEPMSQRYLHNNIVRAFAEFIRKPPDALRRCFAPDGPAPGTVSREDVVQFGFPALAEENKETLAGKSEERKKEQKAEKAEKEKNELPGFIHAVLNLSDGAGVFTSLRRITDGTTDDPDTARRAVEKMRSALYHVLDPHLQSDEDLRNDMASSLGGTEAVEVLRKRLRTSLLPSALPEDVKRCAEAIERVFRALGQCGTSFLTAAVLRQLKTRMLDDVLPGLPGEGAMRRFIEGDHVVEALRFWAQLAAERMGAMRMKGVALIAAGLQDIIAKAPLLETTQRFDELVARPPTRDTACSEYLCELLSEYKKTAVRSNQLTILMRHDMTPDELLRKMSPMLELARRCLSVRGTDGDSTLRFVIFIDEMNTSRSMGMLKRIIVDRYWDRCGGVLPANVSFVCAINPHKKDASLEYGCSLPKAMERVDHHDPEQIGTDGAGGAEETATSDNAVVFDVKPLPRAERDFVVPWEQLVGSGRDLFITAKLFSNKTVSRCQLTEEQVSALGGLVLCAHDTAQQLLLRSRSRSTVSQRDLHRTFTLFDFFFGRSDVWACQAEGDPLLRARDAMLLAIGVAYYYRLRPDHRRILAGSVDAWLRGGENKQIIPPCTLERILSHVVNEYFKKMGAMPEGVFEHQPLRENLFVQLVCFQNRLGVVLQGDPGTSKTLSNNIIRDVMSGRTSFTRSFMTISDVVRYQGSAQSTAEEIKQACQECEARQKRHDDLGNRKLSLLNVDEAGIVHTGNPMGLKVLHYYLGEARLAAVLMTNDELDPAVTNRCVEVKLTKPTDSELVRIGMGILKVCGSPAPLETSRIVEACGKAYYSLVDSRRQLGRWFGLRDFYHLARFCRRWGEDQQSCQIVRRLEQEEIRITPQLLLRALERNFNGTPAYFKEVCEVFQRACESIKWPQFAAVPNVLLNRAGQRNNVEIFKESLADNNRAGRGASLRNLNDMWVRFKLVVDETPDGTLLPLLQGCDIPELQEIQVISLSALSPDEMAPVTAVSQIVAAMEAGRTAWLTNTRAIDGCLFELFNQHYTCHGGRSAGEERPEPVCFVALAVGGLVEYKRVHPDFQIVVHVTRKEVSALPLPFLNRLEKFAITVSDVLEYQRKRLPESEDNDLSWLLQRSAQFVQCLDAEQPTVFTVNADATIKSLALGAFAREEGGVLSLSKDVAPHGAVQALVDAGAEVGTGAKASVQRRWLDWCAALLQIARPEGMIIAADALVRVPHYLRAYFKKLSPPSLRRHVLNLVERAERSDNPSDWIRGVVYVPTHAAFRKLLDELCPATEHAAVQLVGLDSVTGAQHFTETVRSFTESRARVLIVDAGGASGAVVSEAKQLLQVRPADCAAAGAKVVLLLHPFHTANFDSCFLPLFASGWEQTYADAAADVAGIDLWDFVPHADDPAELPEGTIRDTVKHALAGVEMRLPPEDRLGAVQGEDGALQGSAQFYSQQHCTVEQRVSLVLDLLEQYPRVRGELVKHLSRVAASQELFSDVQMLARKVCAGGATDNLVHLLLADRKQVLSKVVQLVLIPILEDFNMIRMMRSADLRHVIDDYFAAVLETTRLGASVDELRSIRPWSEPIPVGGTLPYLPGYLAAATALRVDTSLDPVRAARKLRADSEGAGQRAHSAVGLIAGSEQLFQRFARDCARDSIRHVSASKQDVVVDAVLELVKVLHEDSFGDAEPDLWSMRALCTCEAAVIETHALGMVMLAEGGVLNAEAIERLRRMIGGKAQHELRTKVAQWVREMLHERLRLTAQAEAAQWARAALALLQVPAETGRAARDDQSILASDPVTMSLSIAAAALHADPSGTVLSAAQAFVEASMPLPEAPHVSLGELGALCAITRAVGGAVCMQMVSLSRFGRQQRRAVAEGGKVLRDTALWMCACGALTRAMGARVVSEAELLPRDGQPPSGDDVELLWRYSTSPDLASAGQPTRSQGLLYRAVQDVVHARLVATDHEVAANRRQRATQLLDRARSQGDAAAAAFHAAELAAAEAAFVENLGLEFAENGAGSLPDQDSPACVQQAAHELFHNEENRRAFIAALRKATLSSGGAVRFVTRLMEPGTVARLRPFSEDFREICNGARQLVVGPEDWDCSLNPQNGHHAVYADIERAMRDGDAALADAVHAARARIAPGGVFALVVLCAQRSRLRGKRPQVSGAMLREALQCTPDARPVLQFALEGSLENAHPCGLVDVVGGGADAWQVAAASVLAAAAGSPPGTMLWSMLMKPNDLHSTAIAGDPRPFRLIGRGGAGLDCVTQVTVEGGMTPLPGLTAGASFLLWFVDFTLLLFGAVLNPRAGFDTLRNHVFSPTARTAPYARARQARDERGLFLDFILERSRGCLVHLSTKAGLSVDEASRAVALFCEGVAMGSPELRALHQRMDTQEKKLAAEAAVGAFWRRVTGRGNALLRLPAGTVCVAQQRADEEVERSAGCHLPGDREVLRQFHAAKERIPVLRAAHNYSQVMKLLPPLLVPLAHLHAWVHRALSGLATLEDYHRPLLSFIETFDNKRGHRGAAVRTLFSAVCGAWNRYLDEFQAIQYQCTVRGIEFRLDDSAPLGYFISLPPDTKVRHPETGVEWTHYNVMEEALITLHRRYNETVAHAAGVESVEEYETDNPHLHLLLLPQFGQRLVLRPSGDLVELCRAHYAAPGVFDWEQATREVLRRIGDGLPPLLKPDPVLFSFRRPDADRFKAMGACLLHDALEQSPQDRLSRPMTAYQVEVLLRHCHSFSDVDVILMATVALELFTSPREEGEDLSWAVGQHLERTGTDAEQRARLTDAVRGLQCTHLRHVVQIFADKLESRYWEIAAGLPFEMARPIEPEVVLRIQERLQEEAERNLTAVCDGLFELDKVLVGAGPTLSGAVLARSGTGKSAVRWLEEQLTVELDLGDIFSPVKCSSFVPFLSLVRRCRRKAEQERHVQRPRADEWLDDTAVPGQTGTIVHADGPELPEVQRGEDLWQKIAGAPTAPEEEPGQHCGTAAEHDGHWPDEWAGAERAASPEGVAEVVDAMRWQLQVADDYINSGDMDAAGQALGRAELPMHVHGLCAAFRAADSMVQLRDQGFEGGEDWDEAADLLRRAVDDHPEARDALRDWPCEVDEAHWRLERALNDAVRRCVRSDSADGFELWDPQEGEMQIVEAGNVFEFLPHPTPPPPRAVEQDGRWCCVRLGLKEYACPVSRVRPMQRGGPDTARQCSALLSQREACQQRFKALADSAAAAAAAHQAAEASEKARRDAACAQPLPPSTVGSAASDPQQEAADLTTPVPSGSNSPPPPGAAREAPSSPRAAEAAAAACEEADIQPEDSISQVMVKRSGQRPTAAQRSTTSTAAPHGRPGGAARRSRSVATSLSAAGSAVALPCPAGHGNYSEVDHWLRETIQFTLPPEAEFTRKLQEAGLDGNAVSCLPQDAKLFLRDLGIDPTLGNRSKARHALAAPTSWHPPPLPPCVKGNFTEMAQWLQDVLGPIDGLQSALQRADIDGAAIPGLTEVAEDESDDPLEELFGEIQVAPSVGNLAKLRCALSAPPTAS